MNEDMLTAIVGVVAAVLGAFAQQLVTAARDRMEGGNGQNPTSRSK